MDTEKIETLTDQLAQLDFSGMYGDDFLLTWDKNDDEVQTTFLVAEILQESIHGGLNSVTEIGLRLLSMAGYGR